MLEINMEIRKGILFVRLKGELIKKTIDKLNHDVTELIKDNGVRNVVFNIESLSAIDMKGINALFYNYEICKKNQGKSTICGIHHTSVKQRIIHSQLLKYMYETNDELSAFSLFQ